MRTSSLRLAAGLVTAFLVTTARGDAQQEPRFRGGTNLVRLDVYASKDGVPVTDLTAADFEVREDNTPQTVTSFEFVAARSVVPEEARDPNTVAEMRERAARPDTRLFVLFLDTVHTHIQGSYHAGGAIPALLDRVVGERDLVGVMTPEISARNVTFTPRTAPIGEMLRQHWAWGERQGLNPRDPRDQRLQECFPDVGATAGLASALIARRREGEMIRSLEDLIQHLEGTREERSFVLLLTEGWLMPRPDETLARPLAGPDGRATVPGGPDPIGVTPEGRIVAGDRVGASTEACERQRALLASDDLQMRFQFLMRQANRANVSFYPIDPRGLVVFDQDLGPGRPASALADARGLSERQANLRQLAAETDGEVVLNTNLERAGPRLLTDIGSYYLLGYVSTNSKLDGRYRRLSVSVSRPGVTLRARPGYLAPSASNPGGMQTVSPAPGGGASSAPTPPSSVAEALSRLPVGRRPAAVHLMAAGASGRLDVTVELDRTTVALPEWAKGGRLSLAVEPADRSGAGARVHVTETLAGGARVQALHLPVDGPPMAPGRYQVRAELLPEGARSPVIVSTVVDVPATTALLGSGVLASRRGPGTGRVFEPTADPRFRRTERVQAELARLDSTVAVTARLLNRAGQTMNIPVPLTERPGGDQAAPAVTTDLALAPLAAGEYVLEFSATKDGTTQTRAFPIRIVN